MQINKLLAALALSLAAMVPVAMASTVSNNFTVTATLNSACQAGNSGTQTIAFGTYTAFQAAAITPAAINLTFNCTHKYAPISIVFDTVLGTSSAAGATATGAGELNGVRYTLSAAAGTTAAGTDAVVATATAATQDVVTYAVTGAMAGLQPGECVTATCGPTSQIRSMIVTY